MKKLIAVNYQNNKKQMIYKIWKAKDNYQTLLKR